MKVLATSGLIGDSLGTVPVILDLAKANGGLELIMPAESRWLYPLLPKDANITLTEDLTGTNFALDINRAFNYSQQTKLYMTSCYHEQVGLETPETPPRPEICVPETDAPVYDYLFAPFSRSLPGYQKWDFDDWNELAYEITNLGYTVSILGNTSYDYKNGHEIQYYIDEYDRPFTEVCDMIRKCRKGVISVVTGISHLCYAMGTKNWLLTGQGTSGWGIQPEAKCLAGNVSGFSVDEVFEFVTKN